MHVEPRHTVAELERLERKEKSARVAVRLRAVILAAQGHDAPTVAKMLGRSRRAVQEWVRWYNQEGIAALPDAPRPGQKKKLTPQQEQALCAWLDAGPPKDGPVCAYRGPQVRAHLKDFFGVPYSVAGTYEVLHRLGYSALKPRPRHRKADAAAQEEFKKSAPLLWTACGVSTQAGSSRSGTRTKRVWASRGR